MSREKLKVHHKCDERERESARVCMKESENISQIFDEILKRIAEAVLAVIRCRHV